MCDNNKRNKQIVLNNILNKSINSNNQSVILMVNIFPLYEENQQKK